LPIDLGPHLRVTGGMRGAMVGALARGFKGDALVEEISDVAGPLIGERPPTWRPTAWPQPELAPNPHPYKTAPHWPFGQRTKTGRAIPDPGPNVTRHIVDESAIGNHLGAENGALINLWVLATPQVAGDTARNRYLWLQDDIRALYCLSG
jgi:hypothetical protein